MRRTLIRLNVRTDKELFRSVDRTVSKAQELAYEESDRANFPSPNKDSPLTLEEKIAATPELADVYLSVNTKLGKEELLIRPTTGNPTGLTDIFQHPTPRETLLRVYEHTLSYVEEKFPAESVYRTTVENLIKARREIVTSAKDTEEIEQKVGSGLFEEIIIQAADEFLVAEQLALHKAWEPLEEVPSPDQWIPHSFKDTPQ